MDGGTCQTTADIRPKTVFKVQCPRTQLGQENQEIEAKQRARDLGMEVLRPQEAKVQPPLQDLNFWAAFLGAM